MKPLIWEDFCILRYSTEEAILEALDILKPYLSDELNEKDMKYIRQCVARWRNVFRNKFVQSGRKFTRFLTTQKDWLSREVAIPARFLKNYQVPTRPGIKFREASNYCFMCSDMIGQWALPITWRLSKSLCTVLKLKVGPGNLDFESNLVDCLLCSLCYEKTVELNDLVEELEKIKVKIEKFGAELDAIFARGMENVSLLEPIHGVDPRKFLSPADLRAHVLAHRRNPPLQKNLETVLKKATTTTVPFTTTTRKSVGALNKEIESSTIDIDSSLTLGGSDLMNKNVSTLGPEKITLRKEVNRKPLLINLTKTKGAANRKEKNSPSAPKSQFDESQLNSPEPASPLNASDNAVEISGAPVGNDGYASRIINQTQALKTQSTEKRLEEMQGIKNSISTMSGSTLKLNSLPNYTVKFPPDIQKHGSLVPNLQPGRKAVRILARNLVPILPKPLLTSNSAPTSGTFLNSGFTHSPAMVITQDPRPFKCTYQECRKTFARQRALTKHNRLYHGNARQSKVRAVMICELCQKFFKARSTFQRHMKKHEGKTWYSRPCPFPLCSFKATSPIEFKIHRTTHDESEKTVRCTQPGCTVMFPSEKEMERHKKSRHGEKFTCETCGRGFSSLRNLGRHVDLMHVAPGKKDWICERCGQSFAVERYLKRHQHVYPNCLPKALKPGSVWCKICNQPCSSKNSLNRHLQIIHNSVEKPWACSFCSRNFPIKMYLNRHLKESKYCPGSSSYREISNSTRTQENAGSSSTSNLEQT